MLNLSLMISATTMDDAFGKCSYAQNLKNKSPAIKADPYIFQETKFINLKFGTSELGTLGKDA